MATRKHLLVLTAWESDVLEANAAALGITAHELLRRYITTTQRGRRVERPVDDAPLDNPRGLESA